MERVNCPVCGRSTLAAYGTDVWGEYGPVVLSHTVPGAWRTSCVASRIHPEEAVSIGRILAEGGERFRLAAHP